MQRPFLFLFMLLRVLAVALITAPLANAQSDDARPVETSKTFGDFVVYYTAFPSTDLAPDIATHYQLVRGGDQAIVNISIRNHANGGDRPQPAIVSGTYSDLIQPKKLEFRELREEGAVYYIAQLHFTHRETLRFDINVQPIIEGPAQIVAPFNVSFTRTFFVEK